MPFIVSSMLFPVMLNAAIGCLISMAVLPEDLLYENFKSARMIANNSLSIHIIHSKPCVTGKGQTTLSNLYTFPLNH